MKWAVTLVCAVALTVSSSAQTSTGEPKAPPKASLQGTVVKEPSGEPLKKAIIELIAENQEEGGNYTATSDQEGHFAISDIAPGRYRIFVERTGFLEVDEKRRRSEGLLLSLEAGQELKDQTLHMLAAAVVTGRVTDEDGDPMANVEINVLRWRARTSESTGSAHTNDLGEYRVGGLLPGKYYLVATPTPTFQTVVASQKNGDDPAKSDAPASYAATYYPSAIDRAQASPVELHAGEEMPADFSLTRRHQSHVRGKVAGLRADSKAMIVLRNKDAAPAFAETEVDKSGKFELPAVPPGEYTLIAMTLMSETPMSARQSIDVGASDIDDVQLTLMPPATLRGRVHFGSKFPTSEVSKGMVFLRSLDDDEDVFNGVTMSDDAPSSHGFAKVKSDGSFELSNVPAGVYDLNVSGDARAFSETFVDSVTIGTKNFVDTGIDVHGGTVAVDIAVSSEPGVIEGTVTSEKGQPAADAMVVAVPEAGFRKQASRYQKVSTDQGGKFAVRSLRPGVYTLFAWEHLEDDEYRDADFIKPYESRGVEVKVEKASRQNVSLKVIPTPAEQP